VECCFVGGMACQLYGNSRKPNDLDVFILSTSWSQEHLKRRVVALNPRFFLVDARNPMATYKVLWYRVSQGTTPSRLASSSLFRTHSSWSDVQIKVDLLIPGTMDIPLFPASKITWNAGLPAAPLVLVLLLKLQAWSQHRASIESRFREKQYMDHNDIKMLLSVAHSKGVRILPQATSEAYLPQEFIVNSVARVAEHGRVYPGSKNDWARLGFGSPSSSSSSGMTPLSPRMPSSSRTQSSRRGFGQQSTSVWDDLGI